VLARKIFLYALFIGVAFSIGAPAPGWSGTLWIRNPKDPPGHHCSLLNGWHWDRTGHHFFGTYWACSKVPHSP
jgi:hypothetical protein